MNDHFTKLINELSNLQVNELSNLQAHQTERFWWTNEVDPLNRTIRIVMMDRLSDARIARIVPFDYITETYPVEQARKLIENMQAEMESKSMMSVEETIDQLEDLANDIWYGSEDGKAIWVSHDDYRAVQVAIEALKEKLG